MMKSFRFRIYPNRKQEVKLISTLTTCRHFYNDSLAERRDQAHLNKLISDWQLFPWNGFGHPRFQGRNRYDSFTYPDPCGVGYKITDDGKLKLSKIGEIKIIQHREIEGKVKTCTIKRDVDHWYVTFACEVEPQQLKKIGKSTGVDVGLTSLITLSDGTQIEPHQYVRQSEDRLAKAQRELSRKKKGSNNRNKQRIEVAKIHRKIRTPKHGKESSSC